MMFWCLLWCLAGPAFAGLGDGGFANLQQVQNQLQEWGLAAQNVCPDGNCQFSALVISGNLDLCLAEEQ